MISLSEKSLIANIEANPEEYLTKFERYVEFVDKCEDKPKQLALATEIAAFVWKLTRRISNYGQKMDSIVNDLAKAEFGCDMTNLNEAQQELLWVAPGAEDAKEALEPLVGKEVALQMVLDLFVKNKVTEDEDQEEMKNESEENKEDEHQKKRVHVDENEVK